jgi:hypothetical protein
LLCASGLLFVHSGAAGATAESEWLRVDSFTWEREMKPLIQNVTATLIFAGALAFCTSAGAQQSSPSVQSSQPDLRLRMYEVSREVSVVGTVVRFDAASSVAPMGAHVLLQTASGSLDIHLGNAKVLQANHLDLNPGDNVRIVGETLALGDGTYFAARVVQKGTQAVAVRNTRGLPLTPASTMTQAQKEALRGVR